MKLGSTMTIQSTKNNVVDPDQPPLAIPKREKYGKKVVICECWDQKGIIYYDFLETNER